ncbi:hypothetical protein OUZ56_016381 [Daphnia magna]|uniref:Uncharacterized protein n=1 Tax=Daphnia magna TaxID=35525 RepID=A0ABR0AQG3_9CRUS|nr:hypothetical protein OUZ56_016381 [Daphnia magna]
MDNIAKSLPELRERSLELYNEISVTIQQREAIFSLTANQTDRKYWFKHHAYRITASRFHSVLKTNPSKPSGSTIKDICFSEAFKFSTEATRFSHFSLLQWFIFILLLFGSGCILPVAHSFVADEFLAGSEIFLLEETSLEKGGWIFLEYTVHCKFRMNIHCYHKQNTIACAAPQMLQ